MKSIFHQECLGYSIEILAVVSQQLERIFHFLFQNLPSRFTDALINRTADGFCEFEQLWRGAGAEGLRDDHGSFVFGDNTAVIGPNTVTFWSATWSSQNVLSGGSAPDSFKGFASTVSTNPPVCGDVWASRPGDSSKPPDTLPPYMGVVVSTTIRQSGSTLSGNVPEIVVVKTNAGYAPDPGHPGTGSVLAVYCH